MTPNATISPHEVLKKYKTIAVVGASKNPAKDAYTVGTKAALARIRGL